MSEQGPVFEVFTVVIIEKMIQNLLNLETR
jgi:hypothetical protein